MVVPLCKGPAESIYERAGDLRTLAGPAGVQRFNCWVQLGTHAEACDNARLRTYTCNPAGHSSSHPSSIPAVSQHTSCEPAQLRVAVGAHLYSTFDKAKQKPSRGGGDRGLHGRKHALTSRFPSYCSSTSRAVRYFWAGGTADLLSLELGELDSSHYFCPTAPEQPRL